MPYVELEPASRLFYEDDYFGLPWVEPETILFIHGNAESSLAWFGFVPVLSDRFRLVRVDLRGLGRSGVPEPGYRWSIAAFSDDLASFLDRLGIARVHLVAAKLGGTIALQFAAAHPARVRTLSVFSSPVRRIGETVDAAFLAGLAMMKNGMRDWAAATQRARLGPEVSEEQIAFWNDYMGAANQDVCVALADLETTMDVSRELPRIRAPTQIITTRSNVLQSQEAVAEWVALIPGAALVTLDLDGFHPAATQPAACARLVRAFIDRHPV